MDKFIESINRINNISNNTTDVLNGFNTMSSIAKNQSEIFKTFDFQQNESINRIVININSATQHATPNLLTIQDSVKQMSGSIDKISSLINDSYRDSILKSLENTLNAVNGLVESIDFSEIISISTNAIKATQIFTKSVLSFDEIYTHSFLNDLQGSLDIDTFSNLKSIHNSLYNMSEVDSFSDQQEIALLNATEFVTRQFVQESENINQNYSSLPDADTEEYFDENQQLTFQFKETSHTQNHNEVVSKTKNSNSIPLKTSLLDKEAFMQEAVKLIHKSIIQLVIYQISGFIPEDLFNNIVQHIWDYIKDIYS